MKLDLLKIRKELHHSPELSGNEKKTAEYLVKILQQFSPAEIITGIGGYGVAAVFDSQIPGFTIMFRAELDALPISESNNFQHKSFYEGISHKCGHDGHMTILLGLAKKISKKKFTGKIILLFQPAEENAEGAKKVLADPKFKSLKPDYIFALHNLPGFTTGSIILRKNAFASTSIGIIVKLRGETSHAGHPENGNNPALAMTKIINELSHIPKTLTDSANITIIYAKLGEIAFGTSPGNAVIMATLRAHTKHNLKIMQAHTTQLVKNTAEKYNLKQEIEWVEYFPAIINNNKCVDIIERAAIECNLDILFMEKPFSWSEDFSFFTQDINCALFGLGAGINHAQLHNSDYDFPDEILSDGIDIFDAIINEICQE